LARRPGEIRRIAFLIARKLGRRGMVARRVLGRAERRLTPVVERALVAYLERS
jgi:hypothetical protein